jgi:hypothetical protein
MATYYNYVQEILPTSISEFVKSLDVLQLENGRGSVAFHPMKMTRQLEQGS